MFEGLIQQIRQLRVDHRYGKIQLRQKKGLTLEQVAAICGVNKSTVLRWENGKTNKMPMSAVKVLADYYGVNYLWLMGLTDSEKPQPTEQDILQNEVLRLFKKCDDAQKLKLYNSIKIITDAWGIE